MAWSDKEFLDHKFRQWIQKNTRNWSRPCRRRLHRILCQGWRTGLANTVWWRRSLFGLRFQRSFRGKFRSLRRCKKLGSRKFTGGVVFRNVRLNRILKKNWVYFEGNFCGVISDVSLGIFRVTFGEFSSFFPMFVIFQKPPCTTRNLENSSSVNCFHRDQLHTVWVFHSFHRCSLHHSWYSRVGCFLSTRCLPKMNSVQTLVESWANKSEYLIFTF